MLSKEELEQVLKANGVDTGSLEVFSDRGGETIYTLTTGGAEAVALWQRLRELVGHTGFWPVILGDSESVKHHIYALDDAWGTPASEIIEAALRIDAASLLREIYMDNLESELEEAE